jgi:surfeit locus 1 family protein
MSFRVSTVLILLATLLGMLLTASLGRWQLTRAAEKDNRTDLAAIQTPTGLVQVEGRIAPPPSKLYAPGNTDSGVIRQNLDIHSIKPLAGQSISTVILQQQGAASEGLLRDWTPFNAGVDKHYGYAAQWFGLCGLIAALFAWFQIIQPLYQRSKKATPHV